MKQLTAGQLLDIQGLAKNHNHLVSQASIDFHGNGLMRVTIISTLDADQEDLNGVLEDMFPGMEYRGNVGVEIVGGEPSEFHFIDYNGETLINLCMKKAPVGAEAQKEVNHFDCSTELQEFESLGSGMK
ncbi:hypothetical protein [Desulfosporosinus meridiei]|uniref:Uncharacterized protein n=1 Tax=Desulfosporosinus meridiei (strain ATCC BAA-275 / DSM 13257 / KCTC 12902 / NCIMB 13706 / S10) TaxID=768704 RepID=J7IWW3_DESMD|nr:hypothetical protein [Desulfosporosinus meridiei]AFQ46287.1 hypothetical protein Desmer_4481 [Desulfosporosinus meridiei DSM 13257]